MEVAKKAWDWVVKSSANPEKYSGTLKALAVLAVLLGASQSDVEALSTSLVAASLEVTQAASAVAAAYYAARKLYRTYKGTNQALG